MNNFVKLLSRVLEAPPRVVVESFLASFIGGSIVVYGALEPSQRAGAGPIAALVILLSTICIVMAWLADPDLWEAICRPFERSARIDKRLKEERRAREELERKEAARLNQAEEARRIRLWMLTKLDRDE